jgi:deazaflavin-dependent oxidoreductase (nitroreductase family)
MMAETPGHEQQGRAQQQHQQHNALEQVVDAGFKLLNATHGAVLKLTGGRYPKTLLGMAAVELHTIGRKTGERRTTMLTSPVHDESRIVLVASKGGDHRHPQWYRNLIADPDVEITIDGKTMQMRARTASPEEKAALWPDIVASYKGYASYQERADRDIPVVICEPRGA